MVGAEWHPIAAYLYVLHLDGPSLAWEYLRRNTEYRRDWHTHWRRPRQTQRWGLRLLEDPDLDARDAHPDWFPDPPCVVHVHPDPDPPDSAAPFLFWTPSGERQLLHDGRRLQLIQRHAGRTLRLALSLELEDGMPHVHAVRAGPKRASRWRAADAAFATIDALQPRDSGAVITCGRPGRAAQLHLRTLQALDGVQAGASQRQVAQALYGAHAVAAHWHSDGQLRAHVRRLIARGRRLTQGGYRRLLHPD